MRNPSVGTPTRRGLILALDGLAVWTLAIVLSTYLSSTAISVVDGNLIQYTGGIMRSWIETPAMGVFELTAYAGLSLAVIGPMWYWVIHPLKKWAGTGPEDTESDSDEFVFSAERSESDSAAGLDEPDPLTTEYQRIIRHSRQVESLDWASTLFAANGSQSAPPVAIPEGDFLRSPGGREASDSDGGDESGGDDLVAKVQYSREDHESASERDHGASIEAAVVPNGGTDIEEPIEDPARTDADDVSEQPEAPIDPTEAIGDALAGAREKTDAWSDSLTNGHADAGVDTSAAIADIRDSAHASLRATRRELPDEARPFQADIEAVRASQQQLESAFGALDHD